MSELVEILPIERGASNGTSPEDRTAQAIKEIVEVLKKYNCVLTIDTPVVTVKTKE